MRKANLNEIKEDPWQSPGGKYAVSFKGISEALGREPMRGVDGEGFGCLLGRTDVVVKSMSEEHGILDLSQTSWRPVVGERVRVIPNHVCIVVHLNDVIVGVRGDCVETSWPVAARGRG